MKGGAFEGLVAQNLELKELRVLSHIIISSGLHTVMFPMVLFMLLTGNLNEGIKVRSELNHKCPSHALPTVIVMCQKLLTLHACRRSGLGKGLQHNIPCFYVSFLQA